MSLQIHAPQDSQHWLIQAQKDLEKSLIQNQEERDSHARTREEHSKLLVAYHELGKRLAEASCTHLDTIGKLTEEKHAHEDLKSEHRELCIKHDGACTAHEKVEKIYKDLRTHVDDLTYSIDMLKLRNEAKEKTLRQEIVDLFEEKKALNQTMGAIQGKWWYKFFTWIGL